jgi:hypothetical protein
VFISGYWHSEHLSPVALQQEIIMIQDALGIRKKGENKNRYEVMAIHAFRKYFATTLLTSGVHANIKESLLGHVSTIRLDESYVRLEPHDLLYGKDRMVGYTAAIDALTIRPDDKGTSVNPK